MRKVPLVFSAWWRFAGLWLIVMIVTTPVKAQEPVIEGVFPAGAQPGTVIAVQVEGKNLHGASALISGKDIALRSVLPDSTGNLATVTLEIAPKAQMGIRELRIWTANGVSNPMWLWIEPFPTTDEREPNDDYVHAQLLSSFPVTVNGRIQGAADRDVYGFDAKAGETWIFDCVAARLRSRLDPILDITAANGHVLVSSQSDWEHDPQVVFTASQPGRYYVTVRDTQFQGGPHFEYCLSAGCFPVITSYLPRGGAPGQTVDVSLHGLNLHNTPRTQVVIPSEEQSATYWTAMNTEQGPSLPVPFVVGREPVEVASEDRYLPLMVQIPCAVDGVFERSPSMRVLFRATKGEKLVFDLLGQRIGSRIDGALRILDNRGVELATNDDAVGKDARLEFAAPADGPFTLEIRNVEGVTGPSCFYRLSAHHPSPDFRLTLNVEHIAVGEDGTAVLEVRAEGTEGWDSPISLFARDLPPGIVCSGGTIPRGQTTTEITLSAPAGQNLSTAIIHISGTGRGQGKAVTHDAIPRDTYLPRWIDPALFTDDSYRRPYREWWTLPLAVIPRTEGFAVDTDQRSLSLLRGQKSMMRIRVRRKPDVKGEIKVLVRGLPGKISVDAPSIAAGHDETTITFSAADDAPLAEQNIIVQGQVGSAVQSAPAVLLTVR